MSKLEAIAVAWWLWERHQALPQSRGRGLAAAAPAGPPLSRSVVINQVMI
jgi:hypothetical protein